MKTTHDLVNEAKAIIEEVSPTQAQALIKSADFVIDVRESDEYHQGHLPGAINIPRGLLEFRMASTPELEARDKSIVLYCKSNGRGALAAKTLKEMGYMDVKTIAGGVDAWISENKPLIMPRELDFD